MLIPRVWIWVFGTASMLAATYASHHEKQYDINSMLNQDGNAETRSSGEGIENFRSPELGLGFLSEEFSSSGIDFEFWKHEISAGGIRGQSWEFQYFQNNRSNSYVKDNHLYITPTVSACVPHS